MLEQYKEGKAIWCPGKGVVEEGVCPGVCFLMDLFVLVLSKWFVVIVNMWFR